MKGEGRSNKRRYNSSMNDLSQLEAFFRLGPPHTRAISLISKVLPVTVRVSKFPQCAVEI